MSSKAQNVSTIESCEKPLLLFVDDDPIIVESLSAVLENDFDLVTADSRKQTKRLLRSVATKPSLALIDLGLPPKPHSPEEGFKLVEELMALNDAFKILILSGQNDEKNIHHALTLGAVDFIPKPCDMSLLKARLQHQMMMLHAENREKNEQQSDDSHLIGESAVVNTLRDLINQFADTPFPVLVEGESGTGKELVAEELHKTGSRASEAFVTINCAAFSSELLEAQLFGHARGAYTGANSDRAGFFEATDKGTLFLDEIGELPLDLQSKLLRVLENGEFYRLGETRPRQSQARVIAATNRDLKEAVREGSFRKDLYHRLSVLTISVPPLREREQDVLLLLDSFSKIYTEGTPGLDIDDSARELLLEYTFPGNIRELRNIVIRLSAKYIGKTISRDDLLSELETDDGYEDGDITLTDDQLHHELEAHGFDLDDKLTEWESRYVNQALKMSGGNLSKAAKLLGINRTTLYSRLERLNIKNDAGTG